MADEPEAPAATTDKPAAPRRRAPRKATEHPAPAKKPAARRAPAKPKGAVERVENAAAEAVKTPAAIVTDTARKAVKAVKPRSTSRPAPRTPAKKGKAEPKSRLAAATDKVGGLKTVATFAGSLVAGVATAAALLTLRGSTPKPVVKPKAAHQPDGTDSTASFNAGIADENSVPQA